MKYKYTIFAESEWEEEEMLDKLKSIGLDDIFVEKFRDINSIVADQNNFIDENFDEKLSRILSSEVILSAEMREQLTKIVGELSHKSMQTLFRAIYEAGVECGLPDFRIGRIMLGVLELLN